MWFVAAFWWVLNLVLTTFRRCFTGLVTAFRFLFTRLEKLLRWLGRWIGKCYQRPSFLIFQAFCGFGSAIFFAFQVGNWSDNMIRWLVCIGSMSVVGIFNLLRKNYVRVSKFIHQRINQMKATYLVARSMGFLWVLKAFVSLSNEIDETKHLETLHLIGLLLSCYLSVASVVKLFGGEDLFGVADSLVAVSTTLWVNFPAEKFEELAGKKLAKWGSVIYYGICVLLILFKTCEVNVNGLGSIEDDDEIPISVPLPPSIEAQISDKFEKSLVLAD